MQLHPDCERILMSSEEIGEVTKRLADRLNRDYAGKTVYMICILKGHRCFTAILFAF